MAISTATAEAFDQRVANLAVRLLQHGKRIGHANRPAGDRRSDVEKRNSQGLAACGSLAHLALQGAANSGRAAWFSMVSAVASESARTLPERSMTVARAPSRFASSAGYAGNGSRWSIRDARGEHRRFLAQRGLNLAAQHVFPGFVNQHIHRHCADGDDQQRRDEQLDEDATLHSLGTSKRYPAPRTVFR